MKKLSPNVLLSLFALLALLVLGAAVAQQDMGNTPVTGATYTSGTVRAIGPDSVTIEKDSGETVTLLVNAATIGARELAIGSHARIDYHTNEYAQAVADVIQTRAEPQVVVGSEPVSAPEPIVAQQPVAEPTRAEQQVIPAVTSYSGEEVLPATASVLPTLALLGLLAFAVAVTLRVVR